MPDNDEYRPDERLGRRDEEPTAPQVLVDATPGAGYAMWQDDAEAGDAEDGFGDVDDDPDDAWPRPADRKGIRLRLPSIVLLALLIAAGGFWGGAVVQKHDGTTASASGSPLAAARRAFSPSSSGGRSGPTGSGGAPGGGAFAAGGATVGEVTAIKGSTLYLTTSTGKLVKVTVGSSTTVTRTAKTTLAGLKPGDSVVVTGSTGKNGTVTARSVTATEQGVSRVGGFGGF